MLQYPIRASECSHQSGSDGRNHKAQAGVIQKGALGNVDKNYSNLVNNNRNEQLDFNSMCIDSFLEEVADSGTTGH